MIESAILSQLLPEVIRIAEAASDALLPFYKKITDDHIQEKPDQTPVTQADLAAHDVINEQLRKLRSDWPILSEEGECPDYSQRQTWKQYWLVDPLDGTRGFIRHSDEFTVNIALIDHGKPVLGVIVQPVTGDCFYGMAGEQACLKKQNMVAVINSGNVPAKTDVLRVLCGRFDKSVDAIKKVFTEPKIELVKMNSSIKFCALAHDIADVYCRFGRTSEWDTAAGQCILTAAGGAVVDFNGESLQYNAKSSVINPSFLAVRDHTQLEQYLDMVKSVDMS